MKKAMFGLACAAAMVACADITSSNIVGYTNKDQGADYSLVVPMFRGISANNYALQDLIPSGENVNGNGDISVQTFTSLAEADEQFFWLTEDDMGVEDGDGWYEGDFATKATKVLTPGEGLMLGAASGAITLRFAGQVETGAVEIDAPADYSLIGNVRPFALNIQDIIPSGENVNGNGDISVQTFTSLAEADEQFFWLTEEDMGVEDGDGWYEGDFATKATKVFDPGEGMMLGAASGAIKITFAVLSL